MDSQTRIEELEQRVHDLTGELARLRAAHPDSGGKETALALLVDDVRHGVDRAIGGERGEPLETRIGGIWLGRAAALVMMTTIGLGAATSFGADMMGPSRKVALVYACAIAALAYGLFPRKQRDPFAMTVLGAGFAGLYFATYAAFFVAGMRVFSHTLYALPALAACLAALVATAHWKRSQTVAGIALFLVCYTVLFSCTQGRREEDLLYALATCAALSAVALGFHVAHRWTTFTWVSFVASYVAYILFFLRLPFFQDIPPASHFWLSSGFLTLCFAMFAMVGVVDVRSKGRRVSVSLAACNTLAYFALMHRPVQQAYPEQAWAFCVALAAFSLMLSALAKSAGSQRNALRHVHVSAAAILAAWSIQSVLSGAAMWVALAGMCLLLAIAYLCTRTAVFQVLNIALLFMVVMGCLFRAHWGGLISVHGFQMPANWFGALGVSAFFALIAFVYNRWEPRPKPGQQRMSAQGGGAGAPLNFAGTLLSMAHAASAALILMMTALFEFGDDPALPYLLAAQSLALAAAGILLGAPQLKAASVIPLGGAHVAYHFYVFIEKPGFETQSGYLAYSLLLTAFTYLAGHYWTRYLERLPGNARWDHYFAAAIPYLMATAMLATLIARSLDWVYAPLTYNVLGVALVLLGALTALTGVKASGVLLLTIGTFDFYRNMPAFASVLDVAGDFALYAGIMVLCYAAGERLLHLVRGKSGDPAYAEDAVRTLLAAAAAAIGVAALSAWANARALTLFLIVYAVGAFVIGALFREARYRWAALCVFAVALVRAFRYDLVRLEPFWQVLSFSGLTVALLAISWFYSRYRLRKLRADRRTHDNAH